MVEKDDAIYEEIQTSRQVSSHHSNYQSKMKREFSLDEEEEEEAFTRNSIYEDMNGLAEELADHFNVQNIHSRQVSEPFRGVYSSVQYHKRNTSSSSSEGSTMERQRLLSHSAEEIGRSHPLQNYNFETIYTEIVTSTNSNEITTGRITRESNNPILRQNKMASCANGAGDKRTPPLHDFHVDGVYSCIEHDRNKKYKSASLERNSSELYENSRLFSSSQTSITEEKGGGFEEMYQNSNEMSQHRNKNDQLSSHPFEPKNRASKDLARSNESVASLYENIMDPEEDIYENVSDHEWEYTRERSSSKPINIMPRRNVSFDEDKQIAPFSTSSMSSSVTSSPRGSICSSISSEQTQSISPPPPLPLLSKKRQDGTSSWSDMSKFQGLNYIAANYLGKQSVSKLTHDCIDSAVSNIAQRTNLLEMKPVVTEVSHNLLRIGCNSSPWELIESFSVEEIVHFEVITKNVSFIGIIAGRPGEDALCYVLQSENSMEIADAIREVFQTNSKTKVRQSLIVLLCYFEVRAYSKLPRGE